MYDVCFRARDDCERAKLAISYINAFCPLQKRAELTPIIKLDKNLILRRQSEAAITCHQYTVQVVNI